MPTHTLQRNDNVVLLTITLTDAEFQTSLENEAKLASANVTIPGFRAGNAPLDVVLENVNAEELREKALLNAVQTAIPDVT
jgi:FKBP-type peptidyl-prolyl cis-trans isomerase (trigger factor)